MKDFELTKDGVRYFGKQNTFLGIPYGKKYFYSSIEERGGMFKETIYRSGSLDEIRQVSFFREEDEARIPVQTRIFFFEDDLDLYLKHKCDGIDHSFEIYNFLLQGGQEMRKHYTTDGLLSQEELIYKGGLKVVETFQNGRSVKTEEFINDRLSKRYFSVGNHRCIEEFLPNGEKRVTEEYKDESSLLSKQINILTKYRANGEMYYTSKESVFPHIGVIFSEIQEMDKPVYYALERYGFFRGGRGYSRETLVTGQTTEELLENYLKHRKDRKIDAKESKEIIAFLKFGKNRQEIVTVLKGKKSLAARKGYLTGLKEKTR